MTSAPAEPATPEPVDQFVDWDLAARTAARVARPGPQLPAGEARAVVAALRRAAEDAVAPVHAVTGLAAPLAGPALVVDRGGWARANTAAFRVLLAPVLAETARRRGGRLPAGMTALGSRVAGAEIGTLLGYFSGRVLGQFDAFGEAGGPGTLMLVAPNVVQLERELEVDPGDFRLWVALHEETHRVQFSATPWLADHLLGEVRGMAGSVLVEPAEAVQRLASVARDLPEVLRGGGGNGLLGALQTPEQRDRLARVTAVMSLLEGHADVVMDDVGPAVVPTVAQIRERFGRRRAGRGAVDQLLRRLLGLEAKLRQYTDGARFVRGVIDQVGMAGFNQVWTSPQTLPRPEEIADPAAWIRRVHA